jgi:hypothetical protein
MDPRHLRNICQFVHKVFRNFKKKSTNMVDREGAAQNLIVSNPDGLLTDNSIQSNMIQDLRGEEGRSSKGRI